jgi:hypothetical protein
LRRARLIVIQAGALVVVLLMVAVALLLTEKTWASEAIAVEKMTSTTKKL